MIFKSTLLGGLTGLLLLGIAMRHPAVAQGAADGCKGTSPQVLGQTAAELVSVATPNCTIGMSLNEYRSYAKSLKRLPDLPDSYVFGHTIPKPGIDRDGHIRVPADADRAIPNPPRVSHVVNPASPHPERAQRRADHSARQAAKAEHSSKAAPGKPPAAF